MSFSLIEDYAIVADLRAGGNGSAQGLPELAVGTDPDNESLGRFQWDSNTADGFDSGWVHLSLTIKASGGANSTVLNINNGQEIVSFSGPQLDNLWGVILRAGDQGTDRTTSFRNLSALFYTNESDTTAHETDTMPDFSSTTSGSNPPADAEAIIEDAADGVNFQKLTVFCDIRLQAPEAPGVLDLFGQLFIYGDPA